VGELLPGARESDPSLIGGGGVFISFDKSEITGKYGKRAKKE